MFDYIVVGAGSAGCVLANRLSANPDVSVLLLEAGGADNAREITIPAATPLNFRTDRDWAFETEPQEHLTGSSLYWPRGRVLGGSSAINFMIYMRGNRLDYDDWARNGCDGWSFDEVLPYFKRAEHRESGRNGDYGRDGPLNITDLRSLNPLTTAFVEAAIDSGFNRNIDFNGPEQDGAGYYQVTQKNGTRVSCASAYLTPIRSRPNLTVRTGTLVARVLIENNRAVGVECVQGNNIEKLHAEREVVLSAGTVNSPQLLILSGIGPSGHLEDLDITVEVDLPGVGENLQDHLLVPVIYESTRPVSMASAGGLRDLAAYFLLKRGPLTSNIAEAGAFARTDSVQPAPDLQFNCAPVFYMTRGHEMRKGHGFSMSVVGLCPESRGHIRLRSRLPIGTPLSRRWSEPSRRCSPPSYRWPSAVGRSSVAPTSLP
jgi:choline dehydrogenase